MVLFNKINRLIYGCFFVLFITLAVPAVSTGETFTDSLGRKVTLNKLPSRIIPLAPSLTEILYYLGLGDRVVGVTDFSYYPPEALEKPRVGTYIKLNIEKIIRPLTKSCW